MDSDVWNDYLEFLTGEYGAGVPVHRLTAGHVKFTLDFCDKHKVFDGVPKVLDVGCQGRVLPDRFYVDWVGVDIEPQHEDVVLGDVHELPFGSGVFDVVYCNHTLEHTLSPLIALYELRRVVRFNGLVVVGVPFFPHFTSKNHTYVLPVGSWKHLIEQVGLEIVVTEKKDSIGCVVFLCRNSKGVVS